MNDMSTPQGGFAPSERQPHAVVMGAKQPELQLREQMHQRQQNLQAIAAQLKTELIGIDDVIDRVISAVRAWYVMPQLITRPVIVCLWGLTGTGKTQLTRRLAQLLGYYDRFVEVQMDGFSWATTTSSTRRCRARRTSA